MRILFLSIVATVMVGSCVAADVGAGTDTSQLDQATGEALYVANCSDCHGADLRGTDKGPSHLSEIYEPSHHADAAFLLAIRNGVAAHHWEFGEMAAIPGLDDDEIAAITSYVRDVQEREGFEPYPP